MSIEQSPAIQPAPASDISLRDVMDLLERRKWVVVQSLILATLAAVVVAFLTRSEYRTSAKMMVETPGRMLVLAQVDANSALAPLMGMRQQKTVETQLILMRGSEFRKRIQQAVPANLRETPVALQYTAEERTDIVTVSATSEDPEAAAVWANAATQEYVSWSLESSRSAVRGTRQFLERATARAAADLERAENALLTFQSRTRVPGSDAEHGMRVDNAFRVQAESRQNLTELTALSEKIRILRDRLAAEPEALEEAQVQPNPLVAVAQTEIGKLQFQRAAALAQYQPGSTQIRVLEQQIARMEEALAKLAPATRDVRTRPNPERDRIRQQLRDLELQRAALARVDEKLRGRVRESTRKVENYAPAQVRLSRLERERSLAEKTYVDYSGKLRDLDVREQALTTAAFQVESAPVPRVPVRPDRSSIVGSGMVLGLALGLSLALLQEFLDDRIKSAEDSERFTQLPNLGVVPAINGAEGALLVSHGALSHIAESYRELRTAIQYSTVDHPVQLLLVTSAQSGEGKSVTSANLAIAMALQGKRVILADADLRRPSAHRLFNLDSQPGVTNVLAGDATLEGALHETSVDGLRVLGAGLLPPNPAELLTSNAMGELLAALREHADVVVLDTPPALAVTDALVLAGRVDGVVLVVEADETRRAAVRQARDLLLRTRAHVLGVVLNKLDCSRRGYTAYGYGAPYGIYGNEREPAGARSGAVLAPPQAPESGLSGPDDETLLPLALKDW